MFLLDKDELKINLEVIMSGNYKYVAAISIIGSDFGGIYVCFLFKYSFLDRIESSLKDSQHLLKCQKMVPRSYKQIHTYFFQINNPLYVSQLGKAYPFLKFTVTFLPQT